MSESSPSPSEMILSQTEDGRTRIQCRFEDETLWLTQVQIAEFFQTSPHDMDLHLSAADRERRTVAEATVKSHLIVQRESGPNPTDGLPPIVFRALRRWNTRWRTQQLVRITYKFDLGSRTYSSPSLLSRL